MSIWNIFSKRQKQQRGEVPDIYTYDNIPKKLRVQIVHILRDVLGHERESGVNYGGYPVNGEVRKVYCFVRDALRREYGEFCLPGTNTKVPAEEVLTFILEEPECEKVLDAVELTFKAVNTIARKYSYREINDYSEQCDHAIEELNQRFQEHGVGYKFEGKIIKIDSEFIHSEVVKPALQLLVGNDYKTAHEEFLQSHEYYRHGKCKDCLAWALKSIESTMKIICKKRKWPYKQTDTAKNLINTCFDNGLIPAFWQSHFGSLRAMLESSVPTARNKTSGHGQGTQQVEVPGHLAAYCLHMTASTLVFLIEAEKALT
ncbi:MAG: STM4504/CBY_0614 family protein [Planctomycetota bacterium]|jgi:hypothetical protein